MEALSQEDRCCPGCGLTMPHRLSLSDRYYYNASPECWSVYTEVLAAEYSNAVLFGQIHQLTVDTYAVQHAGGPHPDKSVTIHLAGLYFVLEQGIKPMSVPAMLQTIAGKVSRWPHFDAPQTAWPITVFDVALSSSAEEHALAVRKWSGEVWRAWSGSHLAIAEFLRDAH
jgi:hypothetical protein